MLKEFLFLFLLFDCGVCHSTAILYICASLSGPPGLFSFIRFRWRTASQLLSSPAETPVGNELNFLEQHATIFALPRHTYSRQTVIYIYLFLPTNGGACWSIKPNLILEGRPDGNHQSRSVGCRLRSTSCSQRAVLLHHRAGKTRRGPLADISAVELQDRCPDAFM